MQVRMMTPTMGSTIRGQEMEDCRDRGVFGAGSPVGTGGAEDVEAGWVCSGWTGVSAAGCSVAGGVTAAGMSGLPGADRQTQKSLMACQ